MPLLQRKCKNCDHRFELLKYGSGPEYCCERDEDWDGSCPSCGAGDIQRLVGSSGAGLHTRTFPYYDYALGMQIESYSQWKRVLKARGLEPAGRGVIDAAIKEASQQKTEVERNRRKQQEEQERLEANPEWRRAVDSGYIDALIKQSKADMKRRMR